ncbi:hypothetical protein PHJA_002294400 [Phtheirospermum japonicum]|uniref:Uncharacterized protein n=1 Tax=Phtheirospermum japonicum TaxID=374723 RepID=A0A830CZB1_9LAMI|nr:hypothetical protein PHJA_002294400 [Phtheirospermum japonicum]
MIKLPSMEDSTYLRRLSQLFMKFLTMVQLITFLLSPQVHPKPNFCLHSSIMLLDGGLGPCLICSGPHLKSVCGLLYRCPFDKKVGEFYKIVCQCDSDVMNGKCVMGCSHTSGYAVDKTPLYILEQGFERSGREFGEVSNRTDWFSMRKLLGQVVLSNGPRFAGLILTFRKVPPEVSTENPPVVLSNVFLVKQVKIFREGVGVLDGLRRNLVAELGGTPSSAMQGCRRRKDHQQ